ncbi:MAG TPA: TRAP transporter large permease subunit [Polyangia bacterium]|nr:TRAP transporter large permease subunit [Polyangia bacterium]
MLLPVLLIVACALAGTPLFVVLIAVGFVGLHHGGTPLSGGVADVYRLAGPQAVSLSTIPLFTFAGYLMASARTAQRLIRMAEALLGWVPGGLAVMTVLTCAFFTTFTGASGVTIVAVGGLLLPSLVKAGYGERHSLEVVTGSGSVGLLFPPALPLIVYGIVFGLTYGSYSGGRTLAEFSLDRFLWAGVVPGLVLIALLTGYCVVMGWRMHIPRKPLDLAEFGRAAWEAKWELPIPFAVIAGLATGLTTIPESAALTALYVLVIEGFVYRDVDVRRDLLRIARESMTLVGAIFMKIAGATILTAYFVDSGVPQALFEWMGRYVHSQASFLLVMNVVLLLVGCLMDIFSAIVVVVPLIVPAAATFHIDPYHLGVIFLLNLEIGYLLPPAGLNLFIAAFRFERPITQLYRAVLPFIVLMVVALGLVTYVPGLTIVPGR